jgi:hypothetical protein
MNGDEHGRRQLGLGDTERSDPVVEGRRRRKRQRENVVASAQQDQSWTTSIDIMRWIGEIRNSFWVRGGWE